MENETRDGPSKSYRKIERKIVKARDRARELKKEKLDWERELRLYSNYA